MGNTDPEDKVDQISAPGDGVVLTADSDADKNLIRPSGGTDEHPDKQDKNNSPVRFFRPG